MCKHYTTVPRKNCNYMSLCSRDMDYQRVSTFFGPLYMFIERARERNVCMCGLWIVVWLIFVNDVIFRIVQVCMFFIWKDIQNFRALRASVNRDITSVNLCSISFTCSAKLFHSSWPWILRLLMPCSLVDRYWCFRRMCCLLLQSQRSWK
jgi:hypothetical protein